MERRLKTANIILHQIAYLSLLKKINTFKVVVAASKRKVVTGTIPPDIFYFLILSEIRKKRLEYLFWKLKKLLSLKQLMRWLLLMLLADVLIAVIYTFLYIIFYNIILGLENEDHYYSLGNKIAILNYMCYSYFPVKIIWILLQIIYLRIKINNS